MNLSCLRLVLGPVLSQLRFGSLSMEEFSDLNYAEDLLTDSEIEMIKVNIESPQEMVLKGICCLRKSRPCASPFIGIESLFQEMRNDNEYSCVRPVLGEKFTFVQCVTPFEMVITVSRSIELKGLQISSQVSDTNSDTYVEDIRVQIRDDSLVGRNVLLNFDYRETEHFNSLITIKFPRTVRLVSGREHVIRVTTYNEGMYPTGDCSSVVHKDDNLTFTFQKGFYNSHITGFIRTLLYKYID